LNTQTLRFVASLLACLCMSGVLSCKKKAVSSSPRPIPEVAVVTVTPQTVTDEPEFIGQAEASSIVEVRSQVTGIIKKRFFAEGRDVKKGDRLYQIDPVPFRAVALSAKSRVSQAEARLVQTQQNLARVQPLLKEQAVSQKDVDDAVAEELGAKAVLEGAKGDLVKSTFDFDSTLITAPIDGLVERTRYYEGRLVTAQTDLLTIIHQVHPMYVIVSAPESFLLKRRRDTLAKRIQHPGIYELKGMITFVDGTTYAYEGALDFADVGMRTETGARQARVTFPNPERILMPGQFVTVRFKGVSKNNVFLVPQRAVQQGPTGPFVYVIGNGEKVEAHDVIATNWISGLWLIEGGLHTGEQVVVDGFQGVMPGTVVKPISSAENQTIANTHP
jgi:membrane fusion protein (multidrug efflux system)